MNATTAPPRVLPAFVGWHRPAGGRWARLCEADTLAQAWSLLLARLPTEGGPGGDSIVLATGRHPEYRERPR